MIFNFLILKTIITNSNYEKRSKKIPIIKSNSYENESK